MPALKDARGDQRTARGKECFQKINKRLVTMILSGTRTQQVHISHLRSNKDKRSYTLSTMNKGYWMNSIIVISYYKYILMNITRVIYRNQNKRF